MLTSKTPSTRDVFDKTFRTFYLTVPHGLSLTDIVKMFSLNGYLVDDLCSSSAKGKEIMVWIAEEQTSTESPVNKPGYFLGIQVEEKSQ